MLIHELFAVLGYLISGLQYRGTLRRSTVSGMNKNRWFDRSSWRGSRYRYRRIRSTLHFANFVSSRVDAGSTKAFEAYEYVVTQQPY